MAATFDINEDVFIKHTKKLSKLHKSALPVAIRQTLNDVAFEAKKKIPFQFSKNFIVRKKTFIKSHTSVIKSINTFDVNKMSSQVGVIRGKSKAGDNLVQQEKGGIVKDRDFIPLKTSRVGSSINRLVSKRNYLTQMRINRVQKVHGKKGFRRAAIKAGVGGSVVYKGLLIRIDAINKIGRNNLFIKSRPLYDFDGGRVVNVKKSPFIVPASRKSSKSIPIIFKKNAEKRIKKELK